MRFHFVDRIDSWVASERLTGRKVTSAHEDYWQTTPDGPVMPRALVLESLAQAGSWLLMLGSDFTRRATLLGVEEVRWGDDVRPGDVLRLDVQVDSTHDDAAVVSGTVRTNQATVLEARHLMCALVDAELLEEKDETRRLARHLQGLAGLR
ncbi:3-hydroxylacyl-ACP dehydratase [Nocardia sp. BSTN01]|uniref:3-hydroxylacyl-ACP dehydratase n=1 Tax=Nocardia sp. BSTN01 TaxID=2783665 RepID=UPI00188DEBC0|nr:3-hydroxylacyl-ACP dehydratase [Nocardia sp. BSTN01]MBF5002328.1 3-hydroxylacyl-ACP dehydratase [Nocardia sp. BSTN01]